MSTLDPVPFPYELVFRRVRPLLLVAVVVVALALAFQTFVTLFTSSAWFASLGDHGVFTRRFTTQLVLVLTVGGLAAATFLGTAIVAYRLATPSMPSAHGTWRRRYRLHVHPYRWWVLTTATVATFFVAGSAAAGQWMQWLQWRNATAFGVKDPQFHRDVSYYLFVYPFHRFVVTTAIDIVELSLIVAFVIGVVCGAVRLRKPRRGITRPMLAMFSVQLGLLLLLKAAAYWLDRFSLVVSNRGVVTGASYTDVHAVLPAKMILLVLALIAAVLVFVNVGVRGWRLPLIGFGGMLVVGVVIGGIYPALVQRFSERPNAEISESRTIARNIAATRQAFGLTSAGIDQASSLGVTGTTQPVSALRATATNTVQARVVDPNQVPPTFTQLQQIRNIYGFKSTLDVDHYPVNGTSRDVIIGVRELTIGSLPSSQQSWTNQHLVYTHGYGVVAAPVDTVDAQGEPAFVESNLPPTGVLGSYQPRIYFGMQSPNYSIVGGAGGGAGTTGRELDLPAIGSAGQTTTTYSGSGGVGIGSWFRQLMYAAKFRDANIFLSSQVGHGSKLLYIRNPRSRVAAVAPWLTLDGDPYPVVEGGHVVWVVDGYTTSNNYPFSQQQSFGQATSNTFTSTGSSIPQSGSVNYIRNSVKATVDAYDGTVHLYAWNPTGQPDPVLRTWEKAFPGIVSPQSAIPAALLPHLRYPQDLFNLQRQVLTSYHVTDPHAFYNGTDFWKVPVDPTVPGSSLQPSYYTSYAPEGSTTGEYRLTTSFVTQNKRTLAAFMSVGSQPGPGYGRISVLEAPPSAAAEGPGQIQNDIESDPVVAQQLTLLRGGGSSVVLGNLQSVPLGGDLLYIEPIYTRAAGGTSFPILRRVVAVYRHHIAYDSTLTAALDGVIGGGQTSSTLQAAISAAQQANARAQAALSRGDMAAYHQAEKTLEAALAKIAAESVVA